MKWNFKNSFLGGLIAIVLGSSCCWASSLIIWGGGAAFLTFVSKYVVQYNFVILAIAFLFAIIAAFQIVKNNKTKKKNCATDS